jgi:hypothetical protein
VEIIGAIIEAIVAVVAALIEAIAALFTAGAEALTASEALGVLASLLLELAWWLVLAVGSLLVALVRWSRPKSVPWPRLWRPRQKADAPPPPT